jgi:PHD/YefM family antitoxin component YafN of YafNO toxin-antitoxin module
MTFDKLIGAIPEYFLDGAIQRLHGGEKRVGDSIAEFIYYELKETFDPKLSDEEQVDEALRYLRRGVGELEYAQEALMEAFR